MSNDQILSVVPSLVSILLAIFTRKVLLSLLLGLWIGCLILLDGNIIGATFQSIELLFNVLQDKNHVYVLFFIMLIGALVALIQYSGGVEGFTQALSRILERTAKRRKQRIVQIWAALLGVLLFIESNLSILTVGMIFKPMFNHLRVSREKLAYICDTTCANSCILLPFNAWGVYVLGILTLNGFPNPTQTFLEAILLNFYSILSMALLFAAILWTIDLKPMKTSTPKVAARNLSSAQKGRKVPRIRNMMLPLSVLILSMPVAMIGTGWSSVSPQITWIASLQQAFLKGSGSLSVLIATTAACSVALFMYERQGLSVFSLLGQMFRGMANMLSLAILMWLAFSIGNMCKLLGTGHHVATLVGPWLTPEWLAVCVFLLACVISFSTGTSWGTFAIVLPIILPLSNTLGVPPSLCVAAVLGGGVFGDHCSPISDTTLVSSLVTSCEHITHVRTQLPYALLTGLGACLLYVCVGFLL